MKSKDDETKKHVITNIPEPKPGQEQIDSRPDKDSGKIVIPPKPDEDGRELLND
jgi:hypothetical protein